MSRGVGTEPATARADAEAEANADDDRRARLRRYLAERAGGGEFYCKSKFVADDLDMTPREVGAFLAELREAEAGPRVEKWAYTGATTWRVVAEE